VLPEPVTVKGTTVTRPPHEATWTATGDAAVAPDQYQSFATSAGPLPAAGPLVQPADQMYSDGTVVSWSSQPTAAGQTAPEHPAPSVTVVAAATIATAAVISATSATGRRRPPTRLPRPSRFSAAAPVSAGGPDPVARWLAALVVLLAGAALVVVVVVRRRSPAA
jgi:hypothetical protein